MNPIEKLIIASQNYKVEEDLASVLGFVIGIQQLDARRMNKFSLMLMAGAILATEVD